MKLKARFLVIAISILVVIGFGWLIRPISVQAGGCSPTVTVTDSADSGPNTLRSAIDAVCTGGVIDFDFTLPTTITLTSDTLTLSRTVTIDGSTAPTVTVSGNNAHRVFAVRNNAVVTMTDFTITQGSAAVGAGVDNEDGDLTLTYMRVISNSSSDRAGGINQSGGSLTIRHSKINDNFASQKVGGIDFVGGTLEITHSQISNNISSNTSGHGGGLRIISANGSVTATIKYSTFANNMIVGPFNSGGALAATALPPHTASVRIEHTTFVGNQAPGGGAIFSENAELVLANTTISGNSATSGEGGGIRTAQLGTITIVNSTIANNDAVTFGGGIRIGNDFMAIANSIIADNTAPQGPDCLGTINSNGYNLVESTDACTINGDATNDIYGSPPRLGPLADNGGETQTHSLLSDSPAIDSALNEWCNADPINGLDQRDVPRAAHGANCDIGAFEYIAPVTTLSDITPTSGPESGGTLLSLTGTNFGLAGAIVLVGGQPCTSVVHVVPDTQLQCMTPPGVGADQPVVVYAFGQVSNALLFDYEINIPLNGPGWNLVAYPLLGSQPITEALASIDGSYTTVYGYDAFDSADPWKMYDATVPPNYHVLVNDLSEMEFGAGYWIYATSPVNWVLTSPEDRTPEQVISMLPPPATYYGAVQGGGTFTPMPGQTVEAYVRGTLCGQSETVAMPDSSIAYVVHVSAEGDGSPDCGATGQTITFTVAGEVMAPSASWDDTQANELPLMPGVPTAIALASLHTESSTVSPVWVLSLVIVTMATFRISLRWNG